jgi:hypothetical protein
MQSTHADPLFRICAAAQRVAPRALFLFLFRLVGLCYAPGGPIQPSSDQDCWLYHNEKNQRKKRKEKKRKEKKRKEKKRTNAWAGFGCLFPSHSLHGHAVGEI